MGLDKNGQPTNLLFCKKRNRSKVLNSLMGITQGIVADECLKPIEVFFLQEWLKTQKDIWDDPDVFDIFKVLEDILEDNVVTEDELDDLKEHLYDMIEYKDVHAQSEAAQINELIGILKGIACDKEICDEEINLLVKWLSDNENILDEYPAYLIADNLSEILADGIITNDERKSFLSVINQITGLDNKTTHDSGHVFQDHIEYLEFKNKVFCFTGKFISGSRNKVEKAVQERGAATKGSVTLDVNYLVIGTGGSRDWLYDTMGLKIKKAIENKQQGKAIKILSEEIWAHHMKA